MFSKTAKHCGKFRLKKKNYNPFLLYFFSLFPFKHTCTWKQRKASLTAEGFCFHIPLYFACLRFREMKRQLNIQQRFMGKLKSKKAKHC